MTPALVGGPFTVDRREGPQEQCHKARATSGHCYIVWCRLTSVPIQNTTLDLAFLYQELKRKSVSGDRHKSGLSLQFRLLGRASISSFGIWPLPSFLAEVFTILYLPGAYSNPSVLCSFPCPWALTNSQSICLDFL